VRDSAGGLKRGKGRATPRAISRDRDHYIRPLSPRPAAVAAAAIVVTVAAQVRRRYCLRHGTLLVDLRYIHMSLPTNLPTYLPTYLSAYHMLALLVREPGQLGSTFRTPTAVRSTLEVQQARQANESTTRYIRHGRQGGARTAVTSIEL
jgi:hypothetical protein